MPAAPTPRESGPSNKPSCPDLSLNAFLILSTTPTMSPFPQTPQNSLPVSPDSDPMPVTQRTPPSPSPRLHEGERRISWNNKLSCQERYREMFSFSSSDVSTQQLQGIQGCTSI
ncbi:hypothetical protein AOLI_G00282790 [Acnodon oligacanthus]